MRELIPLIDSGICEISSLPTNYKYNNSWIHVSFLTAANKFCEKYPEKTFDEAMEIICSALIYKKSAGEDKMTPEKLRELDNVEPIWKTKLKKILRK